MARRWQGKTDPLVPYIDTFGQDLPKPWPKPGAGETTPPRGPVAVAPQAPPPPMETLEVTSPIPRESLPSAVSPSLFETTDIEELRETIMREEKEKAAEAWALEEQKLQEKLAAKDREMEKLGEQHQLACEALLRRKEQEINDVLREEQLQHQEQLGEKEKEIMMLKQENQFQREELILRQQELQAAGTEVWEQKEKQLEEQLAAKEAEILKLQKERQLQNEDFFRQEQAIQQIREEERAENQETAKTLERLQEQLVEKDILIDALKEENRMKHEEVLRKEAEMKETLHEEQLRNQEIRDMMIFEETEKTSNFFAMKERTCRKSLQTVTCRSPP